MSKRIFTFWEPKSNMPGYLHLCMRTWAKFLPDYEVVVCDYSNLGDYLDKTTISKILCKEMPLPTQADCVRAALLKTYGGIWLDADTIITSADCFKWMEKSEVVMIGRPNTAGRVHVGFIYTSKPDTHFINAWCDALPSRIRDFRTFYRFAFLRWIFREKWRNIIKWNYCSNAITDQIWKTFSHDKFMLMDRDEVGALPEFLSKLSEEDIPLHQIYQDFYLKPGNVKTDVLDKTKGIVLLHNSRMPKRYRDMTADEFLRQDVLLAALLKEVLK
jgi:mannosyltransferase OCH1-like enzyme